MSELFNPDCDYDPAELATLIDVVCNNRNPDGSRCYGVGEVDILPRYNKVIVFCEKCGTDLGERARATHRIPRDAPLLIRPIITLTGANLQYAENMLAALEAAERPHYNTFVIGSTYSMIQPDGTVEALNRDALKVHLAEVAQVRTPTGNPTEAPANVVAAIFATARTQMSIPHLERVITVPTFLSDGTLLNQPGYDAPSRTYYQPTVEGIKVLHEVTQADVDAAVVLLVDEYLGDVAFATQSDRANCIGCMLLSFVRTLVGPTPLHVFAAPGPGHGKTQALYCALLPGCGAVQPTKWSHNGAEQTKKLFAALRKAPSAMFIDNVDGRIESEALEAILTSPTGFYEERVLGSSSVETVPVHQVWTMSTNNGVLGTSMKRRALTIYINADCDEPMTRRGPTLDTRWRHKGGLVEWGSAHRAELVNACLVLCQWWLQHDRPEPQCVKQPMGSFERYQEVIGGILELAGITEFSDNWDMRNDEDLTELKLLFNALHNQFGENWFSAREAVEAGLSELTPRGFGAQLSNARNRRADGLRLIKRDDGTSNAGMYRLEEVIAVPAGSG